MHRIHDRLSGVHVQLRRVLRAEHPLICTAWTGFSTPVARDAVLTRVYICAAACLTVVPYHASRARWSKGWGDVASPLPIQAMRPSAEQTSAPSSPRWPDHDGAVTRRQETSQVEATLVSTNRDAWRRTPMRRTARLARRPPWRHHDPRRPPTPRSCGGPQRLRSGGPGDQAIPSEAQWTATPPMRSTGDGNQLASVLVDPAMITPPESPALMPSQAAAPVPPSRVKAWTWDEIDHTRVRSSAGD